MTEFIRGAAYVSPSRDQLWTYDQLEICRLTNYPIPDDLVLVWAPGEELPIRYTRIGDQYVFAVPLKVGGVHVKAGRIPDGMTIDQLWAGHQPTFDNGALAFWASIAAGPPPEKETEDDKQS